MENEKVFVQYCVCVSYAAPVRIENPDERGDELEYDSIDSSRIFDVPDVDDEEKIEDAEKFAYDSLGEFLKYSKENANLQTPYAAKFEIYVGEKTDTRQIGNYVVMRNGEAFPDPYFTAKQALLDAADKCHRERKAGIIYSVISLPWDKYAGIPIELFRFASVGKVAL